MSRFKNFIREHIVKQLSILTAVLFWAGWGMGIQVSAASTTYNPNDAPPAGYHWEVDSTTKHSHEIWQGGVTKNIFCKPPQQMIDYTTQDILRASMNGSRPDLLFPTAEQLRYWANSSWIGGQLQVDYAQVAGMGSSGVYTLSFVSNEIDRPCTLAQAFVTQSGYAGYVYYGHTYLYCPEAQMYYWVSSYHTWYGACDGEIGLEENHPVTNEHILTLYQAKPNGYTVKFDGNGAQSGVVADIKTAYDTRFAIPQNGYTREGHSFLRWNTRQDGTGTAYSPGDQAVNLTGENNGTVTLYAQWSAQNYNIHYEGNGATEGSMADQAAARGQSLSLSRNCFGRTGHGFTGWNTQADGSGQRYTDGQSVRNLAQPGQTATLYAQWKGAGYRVQFDGNGATGGGMEEMELLYDQEAALFANGFIRKQEQGVSVFLGWSRSPEGSEPEFTDGQRVCNLTAEEGATVVLYAVWDDSPLINACDRYFTLDFARAGHITEKELLGTASGTDREDVTLENRTSGQVAEQGINGSLSLYAYSTGDFINMEDSGSVSMTYKAVDSIGNTVYEMVTVFITNTEPLPKTDFEYTRFINEKYYHKPYEEGGLHPESVWRNNQGYCDLLQAALNNLKNGISKKILKFSHEEVIKMQTQIRLRNN